MENYRIHKDLTLQFVSGINLLLGQNGQGKSSVLEAIGVALFDSKTRTSFKEAVRFGEKKAKVEVEFTAIDNLEYKVTKTFPSGTQKLVRISDGMILEEPEKLKELCGIKGEIKDIYDNIIVAKQNEFISVFKDTPANRERVFNKIFNTDVYTTMYSGYLKDSIQKYEKLLSIEKTRVEESQKNIEDEDILKEELNDFEIQNVEIELKKERVSKKVEFLNENLETLGKLENSLESLKIQERNLQENIEDEIKNRENIQKNLENAELAQKKVLENFENFEKYNKINIERENLQKDKNEAEKIKEKYLKAEKYLIRNASDKDKIENEIEINKNNIKNINENLEIKRKLQEKLELEILEKTTLKEKYIEDIHKYKGYIEEGKRFQDELDKIVGDLEKNRVEVANFEKSYKEIFEEIEMLERENLEEKLEKCQIMSQKIKVLKDRNNILENNLQENKEAMAILGTSFCPYLKEKCENLKDKNIEDYFEEKFSSISKEMEENLLEIAKIKEELNGEEELKEKKYRLTNLLKNGKSLENNLEKSNLQLEKLEKDRRIIELEFEKYKLENKIIDMEEISKKLMKIEIELHNLDIEKLIDEKEEVLTTISKEEENIEEIKNKNDILTSEIEDLERKKITCNEYIEENSEILIEVINLNGELERKEESLKELEESRNLYLKNYDKAQDREKFEIELEAKEKIIGDKKAKLSDFLESIEELKRELVGYDKENLLGEKDENEKILAEIIEKIGEIKNKIVNLKEKIELNKKNLKEVKETQKKINKLEEKIYLGNQFRDKIKGMGKEVSKHMLSDIEILATSNFRKITGRGDMIIWSNEESDKYAVYLSNSERKLKFEQLSGGEQVAVSIAIRSAMSELFTDSKFSIFDEPTNNLDIKRRESLASSIGEILKNLEQSIIVTHDDTFREMANKVIVL